MAKDSTIRFAFGTEHDPASSVWRLVVRQKTGDTYINNAPPFGDTSHLSIHASGHCHYKLGENRVDLMPVWTDPTGVLWGPIIFFHDWVRLVPPLKPTGKVNKIIWLGRPKQNHLFLIKLNYCDLNEKLLPHDDEIFIAPPIKVKVFHKDHMLYLVLQERAMTQQEMQSCAISPAEPIRFEEPKPKNLRIEMTRIAKNTDLGPSAIIIERFSLEDEQ